MRGSIRTRTEPATLWIGEAFSALEHVCLKSLVVHGMNPVLFCYDQVRNVPSGVTIKDANEIVPQERIWINKERNSLAPFSDMFRYHLLKTTDYYWVDADVLALRPFDFSSDYFLAWHPPVLNIAVLSLPHDSPTLTDLINACENPNVDLPWLRRHQEFLKTVAKPDGKLEHSDLPYKALGPRAITWLMKHHGEHVHALPQASHYPLQPRHIQKPHRRVSPLVDWDAAYSVHLFGSVQHKIFHERGSMLPPEGCFLEHIYQKFDVDPRDFAADASLS